MVDYIKVIIPPGKLSNVDYASMLTDLKAIAVKYKIAMQIMPAPVYNKGEK
jgi:hypothetical protein